MAKQVEYWRWMVVDEVTGKRRPTSYLMDRKTALERYPGATPIQGTLDVRTVFELGEAPANTRPGPTRQGP